MKFRDLYYFLSNMYPTDMSVNIKGKNYTFKNAEAMFQAQKNLDLAYQFENIDGFTAKRLGRRVPIKNVTAWNNVGRINAMGNALHNKFKNPDLMAQLKNVSGDIVEDNSWGDTYWGRSNGEGENVLGQMLMNIRDNDNDVDELHKLLETFYKI